MQILNDNPQYRQVMRAMKKQDAVEGRWKLPVLPEMLHWFMRMDGQKRGGWTLRRRARATCALLMFCYLLRVSEGTCTSMHEFLSYPGEYLSRGNISFGPHGEQRLLPVGQYWRTMEVQITHRKNSQMGKVTHIRHSRLAPDDSGAPALERLDVVTATQDYLRLLQELGEDPFDSTRPLFAYVTKTHAWTPVTPKHIRQWLASSLRALGIDPSKYSSHSLRKGGATAMYRASVPLELIRMYGGWADTQFLTQYVFPDENAAVGVADRMMNGVSKLALKHSFSTNKLRQHAEEYIRDSQHLECHAL